MREGFTKEGLRKFLAENLLKSEDELLAAVTVTFAALKAKAPGNPDIAEVLPDLVRLTRAGIQLPYEDFKDMVEEYVLTDLG